MAESNEGAPKSKPRRGPGRPFQKGQSGNPGGRKPDAETREVRELAKKFTNTAVMTLVRVCRNGDKDAARVAAAVALLDRGHGKPLQSTELDVNVRRGGILVCLPPEEDEPIGAEAGDDALG